jgi:hypothetical protein
VVGKEIMEIIFNRLTYSFSALLPTLDNRKKYVGGNKNIKIIGMLKTRQCKSSIKQFLFLKESLKPR